MVLGCKSKDKVKIISLLNSVLTRVYAQLNLSKVVSFGMRVIDLSKFIYSERVMEFFGIDRDPVVGIDIGSTSIKLMQVGRNGNAIVIENFAIQPLEPGWIVEKNIINREKVIEGLIAITKKSGITTRKVCAAVSSSMVITKVLKMSSDLSDKEIGNEIEIDSDKYIPYPLSEVNLDYCTMGPIEGSEGMINVLLAASKSDNIELISTLLKEAGLKPSIIDVDSFAMMRAFESVSKKLPGQGKDKLIALFDIGATLTTLTIFDNDRVVYSREQAFGSQQLIDEIQNVYGLNYDEAIIAMRYEDLPKDFYHEVLDPFKQTIAQQISRFCQFFFSAGDYSSIDYVFLTGGCSAILGLDHVVQNKLQIKTFVANPFTDITFSPNVNKEMFKDDMPRLLKCYGLALRNLDKNDSN